MIEETKSAQQGVLIFHLPEERCTFEVAVKAMDFALAWADLREEIRKAVKYGTGSKNKNSAYEEIQRKMFEIQEDRGLPELI
jgi:hypothetical protein